MRKELIKKYLTKEMKGIEIAPWHSPIVPKAEGYRVEILDIFDTDQLREKCLTDPNVPDHHLPNIEEVDFVASALEIDAVVEHAGALGTYDYIVSSHNFEHLPNPIKFLQGCGKVLKTGGHLSMAIPSKNYTFDFFRGLTTTSDFFESFFEKRTKPSPYQIYDFLSCRVNNVPGGPDQAAAVIAFDKDLEKSFQELKERIESLADDYIDTHVSVFTADSFHLIVCELISLGLIPYRIKEIINTGGFEFFVHLEKVDPAEAMQYKLSTEHRFELYKRVYGSVKTNRTSYGFKYNI